MIISDINYLEVADKEANVVGAGGYYFPHINFDKDVDIKKDIDVDIKKDVFAKVFVKGNLAEGQATATSYGYDSLAETHTVTYTDYYSSAALSESTSATY